MRAALLLLALALSLACGDDPPPNEPGVFGEPCEPGIADGEPDGCDPAFVCGGTSNSEEYCTDKCTPETVEEDCRTLPGVTWVCITTQCRMACETHDDCPQDLERGPMYCKLNWCTFSDVGV